MGKLDGKVAIVTGGARGQGRSHAVTLAGEGADIVICDIADQVKSVPYKMSTPSDLQKTVGLVEETGRRCIAVKADVRETAQMSEVMDSALSEFGKVDILVVNHGICSFHTIHEMPDATWDEMIGTNLTGVFKAMRAVVPHMVARGYGRIVATSSMAGRAGWENIGHYAAAKWGIIGLAKSLALEVAAHGVTVNVICPSSVNTDMMHNDASYKLFRPDLDAPTREDALPSFTAANVIPVPWVEPVDISRAIMFLVSDDARYITGETLAVAAGVNARNVG